MPSIRMPKSWPKKAVVRLKKTQTVVVVDVDLRQNKDSPPVSRAELSVVDCWRLAVDGMVLYLNSNGREGGWIHTLLKPLLLLPWQRTLCHGHVLDLLHIARRWLALGRVEFQNIDNSLSRMERGRKRKGWQLHEWFADKKKKLDRKTTKCNVIVFIHAVCITSNRLHGSKWTIGAIR